MKRAFALTVASFFLFSASVSPVFAARSLTISSNKNTLFGYEDMSIVASSSGFTDGETIYIKGAFYQDGTTSYFGYTKKGEDEWVKNGETTPNQKSVKIGEWDSIVIVKSDFSDSGYKGEGGYKLKVGFYYITSGGNLSSPVTWSSNSLDVNINDPDPTPTMILTPAPSSTPKPPTSTPASTSSPTATNTPVPSPSATPSSEEEASESAEEDVLGDLTALDSSPTPASSKIKTAKTKGVAGYAIPFIFFGSAAVVCAILTFYLKNKNIWKKISF